MSHWAESLGAGSWPGPVHQSALRACRVACAVADLSLRLQHLLLAAAQPGRAAAQRGDARLPHRAVAQRGARARREWLSSSSSRTPFPPLWRCSEARWWVSTWARAMLARSPSSHSCSCGWGATCAAAGAVACVAAAGGQHACRHAAQAGQPRARQPRQPRHAASPGAPALASRLRSTAGPDRTSVLACIPGAAPPLSVVSAASTALVSLPTEPGIIACRAWASVACAAGRFLRLHVQVLRLCAGMHQATLSFGTEEQLRQSASFLEAVFPFN